MPCYTAQTMSVEFQAENTDLLLEALREMKIKYRQHGMQLHLYGGSIVLDLQNQQAQLTGSDTTQLQKQLNKIKQGYSLQAIKTRCAKHHWLHDAAKATAGLFSGTMMKRRA
jgi:hypothetical protein